MADEKPPAGPPEPFPPLPFVPFPVLPQHTEAERMAIGIVNGVMGGLKAAVVAAGVGNLFPIKLFKVRLTMLDGSTRDIIVSPPDGGGVDTIADFLAANYPEAANVAAWEVVEQWAQIGNPYWMPVPN